MRALVTGGGGFLGKAIVKLLLDRRNEVRSFSRGNYPELRRLGVEQMQGDLTHGNAVSEACRGCDIVFHVAAKAGIAGPWRDFYNANFIGTQNVIHGCRAHNISRLVYTSSASVVFDGRDMEGATEAAPYPKRYDAHYPGTKAMAERLVLDCNSTFLSTVSLRPHLIFGPEDNHLVPRILARARQLRIVGDGVNRVDTVYIDNAAEAHLLAADRLGPGSPISGKTYFITQDEPQPLWEIVNRILKAAQLPPVTRKISPRAAVAVGWMLDKFYSALRLKGEPRMTPFLARELSTSHWFDITAARRDLDYSPHISFDEGMRRLEVWLREQKDSHP